MLEISIDNNKGVMFIQLEGNLNNNNFCEFNGLINYLLYKKDINYYVFDFNKIDISNNEIVKLIKNKINEISKKRGKVCLYGINCDELRVDNSYFINSIDEAFNYLVI